MVTGPLAENSPVAEALTSVMVPEIAALTLAFAVMFSPEISTSVCDFNVIFRPDKVIEPSLAISIDALPAPMEIGTPAGTFAVNASLPSRTWCAPPARFRSMC